ncbi:hypothetical protein ACFR9U_17600 [Halorientalis brevis]|uniref:Uncharacterized protein n=1 Tax=Halorientalis brevis TaxID=1126241 RepID=A0ABD6CGI3_9EURY|nr:hypothetical protein [Halorientalis brevis]
MTWRPGRRFRDDDRGKIVLQVPLGAETLFSSLVAAVVGLPLVAALAGSISRREHAFKYVYTGAAALVAVFTLTGTMQFAPHWTIAGILAVLTAIAGHVWQFRHDRLGFVIVGLIYLTPVLLAYVLLFQVVGAVL